MIKKQSKKPKHGDKSELEKLVEQNNGLIWSIVKRFNGRGYELEDLYQVGCMGFIKSIQRFDLNFDVSYKIVKENDYINVLIDRFEYKDKETKNRMENIRKIVNEFINKKANNT